MLNLCATSPFIYTLSWQLSYSCMQPLNVSGILVQHCGVFCRVWNVDRLLAPFLSLPTPPASSSFIPVSTIPLASLSPGSSASSSLLQRQASSPSFAAEHPQNTTQSNEHCSGAGLFYRRGQFKSNSAAIEARPRVSKSAHKHRRTVTWYLRISIEVPLLF